MVAFHEPLGHGSVSARIGGGIRTHAGEQQFERVSGMFVSKRPVATDPSVAAAAPAPVPAAFRIGRGTRVTRGGNGTIEDSHHGMMYPRRPV
jgi:hypothetical protein